MKVKAKRQAQILKLISTAEVETQEEITLYLKNQGFRVTQATVSRDIKDLHLVKTVGSDKSYRYMASEQIAVDNIEHRDRFSIIFRDGVLSVHLAQQLVIVRCRPGMAPAVAAVIDSAARPEILGSIAGDDTIFLAADSEASAQAVVTDFKQVIKQ